MEPCLFRHGKEDLRVEPFVHQDRLQWSHVFSDMVRVQEPLDRHDAVKLQWSHVFSDMVRPVPDRRCSRSVSASMEPCLFRHGKPVTTAPTCSHVSMLQWSHVFSDMVRKDIHGDEKKVGLLQWSHVFSDMVRKSGSAECRSRASRFNGAMSFQTW